ncbi:MAG: hypothetical protein ABL903_13925 [Methylococcales bacterium]
MRKYFFVVFLALLSLPVYAINLATAIDSIEKEWAEIYYNNTEADPSAAYQRLLLKTQSLAEQTPSSPEPLLWEAIIIATDANHQLPLQALEQVNRARDLLQRAIAIDPNGVNGSAQVTLGTLYYMSPPWPIGFGDIKKAEELFLLALKINSESIEANYFYGDFLLSQNRANLAAPYFKKALTIPARNHQLFADQNLQQQASLALSNANERKINPSKKLFLSLFNDAETH